MPPEEEKSKTEPNYEQLAEAARQNRRALASTKIQQVLQEHNCDMLPVITIMGTRIQAAIQIVPKP